MELEVVWNGSMSRHWRELPEVRAETPVQLSPAKDGPYECRHKVARARVLALQSDGKSRRIKAIGRELHVPQRILHGFVQRWKRTGIVVSDPTNYGHIRLVTEHR